MSVLVVVSAVVGWLAGSWLFTLLLALTISVLLLSPGGRPKNFPPGTPILPVVGSLYTIPFGPTRAYLQGLKKKYGNMASFGMFNSRFVMVSGASAIKEVFAHRNTTGRMETLPFTGRNYYSTNGRTGNLGIIGSWGELWHDQRRFVLHHLRNLGLGKTSCEPMMMEEVTELLGHIQKQEGQPIKMKRLFNRSIINVLWGMIMGKRYPYNHTKLITLLETFIQPADFNLLAPIWSLPNVCKWMSHVPILKNELKPLDRINQFIKEELQDFIKNEDVENSDCFVAVFLREMKKQKGSSSHYNMDQLISLVWDLFVAGMETTSNTLTAGFKMMMNNPKVASKVRHELDQVVGPDRLPAFSDMEHLPYTQATICEIQRRFNLVPYALPHTAIEDCTFDGYHIPKGTVLLPNLEDLMTDPRLWPNAESFDPNNFLTLEGKTKKSNSFFPFGTGKRVCAGESLARLELFLFFSCLMKRFDFTFVSDHTPASSNPMFPIGPDYLAMANLRKE